MLPSFLQFPRSRANSSTSARTTTDTHARRRSARRSPTAALAAVRLCKCLLPCRPHLHPLGGSTRSPYGRNRRRSQPHLHSRRPTSRPARSGDCCAGRRHRRIWTRSSRASCPCLPKCRMLTWQTRQPPGHPCRRSEASTSSTRPNRLRAWDRRAPPSARR